MAAQLKKSNQLLARVTFFWAGLGSEQNRFRCALYLHIQAQLCVETSVKLEVLKQWLKCQKEESFFL